GGRTDGSARSVGRADVRGRSQRRAGWMLGAYQPRTRGCAHRNAGGAPVRSHRRGRLSMTSAEQTRKDFRRAALLFVLTLGSTLYAGALQHGYTELKDLWRGYDFALPLLAILLCHEMGHYIAARIHGVDVSPPFFIPLPLPFTLIGTMG